MRANCKTNGEQGAWWTWRGMRDRCESPGHVRFSRYGGSGIRVCGRWLTFENFLADMGERPDGLTLDRIDNDGDYEPGNCRWATTVEQRLNTSRRGHKLDPASAMLIRFFGTQGVIHRVIGDGFGVSQTLVSEIIRGEIWR